MTLDEGILRDVEAARGTLEDLEDRAYEARATLHQAIRRLHAAGGSMREIATALGMSHQRVHQIIGADGIVEVEATEVAPLPVPSSAATAVAVTAGEDTCSFCGAPRRELDKLLAAPGPVFICSRCVAAAAEALGGGSGGTLRVIAVDEDATCSFCRNPSSIGGVMAEHEAGAPRICRRCVSMCERLVTTESTPAAKPTIRRNAKVRCSFCNVSASDTSKLIAGPGVYICGDCVFACGDVLVSGDAVRGPRQVTLRPATTESHDCDFCGKSPAQVQALAKGGRGRICNECLSLCDDILAGEASSS